MHKHFLHFLIAAVTYYLAGRLGLLLSIPPGFASAVWPASGLALACALLLRRTAVLCGVGTGSFLLNLGVASQNFNDLTMAAVPVAAMISLGAMLQCGIGVLLFRRLVGAVGELDIANNVLRFLGVVAPMGCLVAASVGVFSLYVNSVIAIENIGFSWLTWWLGDTIGILLFTPLTLSLFSPSEKLTWSRKAKIVLPPTIIFIAVLLLFFNSLEYRRQSINAEVQDKANYFFQVIEERLRLAKNKLDAYVAYYAGTETVTRDQFDAFSRVLLEGDTIFQGVGWTEIIPAGRREEVESEVRAQGFADFHFTELNGGELTPNG
ncbi:MAG: MASE1 domain-containing protein [Hahellaceae bacterium]|nr:MASE1 domain-containing protein [Hahellaceae bacterium]MCP5211128.1 MASE1 domain-containing protein [Hahellaceae bacterium]